MATSANAYPQRVTKCMVIDFCDTAKIRGKELDPLVSKIKVQKTLSLHMADYIMTRRMNNGSTALRDTMSGQPLEFLRHIRPYPLKRRNLVMTSLAARAGAVLHNIARQGTHLKNNRVHKFALDMRYNLVLGDYRRVREFMNETDKIGSCPNESKHSGRNARSHNPSKGGRCLINCIGGSKIWMHNAVVSALAKRINGKGFVATAQESTIHQTVRKQADITVIRQTDVSKPLYVDVTVVQQESNLKSAPKIKLTKSDHIVTCEDIEGKFVSRNHIFRKGTSRKLRAYADARKEEVSQGGESKPSVYSFAMDTNGSFCDTAILFLKKIAVVKFSDEPGSAPLLAWKRANWVQETCSLIQDTLLHTASFYFHRGLHRCFPGDYDHLFNSPANSRLDNNTSGRSPIYIPAAG